MRRSEGLEHDHARKGALRVECLPKLALLLGTDKPDMIGWHSAGDHVLDRLLTFRFYCTSNKYQPGTENHSRACRNALGSVVAWAEAVLSLPNRRQRKCE